MITWYRKHFFDKKYRFRRILLLFLISALGIIFITLLANWSERKALLKAKISAHETLVYQSSNVVSHLNKFSLITAFIAKRPDVVEMFRTRNVDVFDGDGIASIASGLSGAQDFWFVDHQGIIFSSSSSSLIGRNVKNERYFEAAFQGRLGRTSKVDTNGERYYVYASPVFVEKKVAGLVAVRVDLEVIESVWVLLNQPIVATEADGRVLLSNIESWRLIDLDNIVESQLPLPPIQEDTIYPTATRSLNFWDRVTYYFSQSTDHRSTLTANDIADVQSSIVRLARPFDGKNRMQFLSVVKHVPLLEWQVHVLVDLTPVKRQRLFTVIFGVLILTLMILLMWVIFERQRRSIERIRHQQAFSLRLERQVRDRTHELTSANEKLELEVNERKLAEEALKETQEDLVQAAKLAGIGQMSAALAHEYNQPLAAIRSYADNAVQLLHMAKEDDVQDNLRRITALTERMADLTKTLRSFAHKSDIRVEPVLLSSVVDEMVILLSPQAKKQNVELRVTPPAETVYVMAGHLRLSQVIINIVTNAMDAVKDSAIKCVNVSWEKQAEYAVVTVKDTGEGISEEVKDKMFMPFFTTKGAGVGLGLGLFIVYNMVKEFKGSIEVNQEEGYGSVFTISLPLAAMP